MKSLTAAVLIILLAGAIPQSKSESKVKTTDALKAKFTEKVVSDGLKAAEIALDHEAGPSEPKRADPVPVPSPMPVQGPVITLPNKITVPQAGMIFIRASSFVADDIRWWAKGIQTFPNDFVKAPLGSYAGFVLTPGVYTIHAIPAKSIDGKAVIGEPSEVEVTVLGSGPVPVPVPTPTPVPVPTPIPTPVPVPVPVAKGPYWISIFDDYTKRTPASAAVVMSALVRSTAQAQGSTVRLFDGSQADDAPVLAAYKPWIDKIGGTPCVIIGLKNSVPTNKVVTSFKLPQTEAQFDALLKGLGQ